MSKLLKASFFTLAFVIATILYMLLPSSNSQAHNTQSASYYVIGYTNDFTEWCVNGYLYLVSAHGAVTEEYQLNRINGETIPAWCPEKTNE